MRMFKSSIYQHAWSQLNKNSLHILNFLFKDILRHHTLKKMVEKLSLGRYLLYLVGTNMYF